MPGDLRRRVERLEHASPVGERPLRIRFVSADAADPEAEIARHHAEADRDGFSTMVVTFVRPQPYPPTEARH